jgi:hypothetical protein
VLAFDEDLAYRVAALVPPTRPHGLSLGTGRAWRWGNGSDSPC